MYRERESGDLHTNGGDARKTEISKPSGVSLIDQDIILIGFQFSVRAIKENGRSYPFQISMDHAVLVDEVETGCCIQELIIW